VTTKPRAVAAALLGSLLCIAQVDLAQAGRAIKAKLASPGAAEEASGSLTLDGYTLTGHLSGEGIDVTISGTVKSSSVSVLVTGRIMPNCSVNRQSMSGEAANRGTNTSVIFDFTCTTKGGSRGRVDDYLYRLDLGLPPLHPISPGNSDPGEEALNGSLGLGEVQRYLT